MAYALALLSSTSWPSSAFADGDDDDHEEEEDDDDDRNERDDSEHDGSGNTQRKGGGNTSNDRRNDEDDDEDEHNQRSNGRDDEEHALEATRSNQAMPLRKIIQNFRNDIGGDITEIRLFERADTLIYRFQYINKDGHVVFVKYNAATGKII